MRRKSWNQKQVLMFGNPTDRELWILGQPFIQNAAHYSAPLRARLDRFPFSPVFYRAFSVARFSAIFVEFPLTGRVSTTFRIFFQVLEP